MKKLINKKLLKPLLFFLKQGTSPRKLSLTLALGITIGIIPVLGINTFLLAILALVLRLNLPAVQVVNYAVYVFQIILFVPFLSLGNYLFNGANSPIELSNVLHLFEVKFWDTFYAIWQINLLGLLVWLIIAIPMAVGIYYLSLPYFIKKSKKMGLDMA